MSDIDNTTEQNERKTSRLAKWAFRLAVVNAVLFSIMWLVEHVPAPQAESWLTSTVRVFMDSAFMWLIFAVPTVFLISWISLVIISGSRGKISGVWRALGGSAVCIIIVAIAYCELRGALIWRSCSEGIRGIAIGMDVYATENNNSIPPAENWCDLIIEFGETSPYGLLCHGSDAKVGESSYAINSNAAGKNWHTVPDDMVLLFETDYGKIKGPRDGQLSERPFYTQLQWDAKLGSKKTYSKRWNQSGGAEIAATKHHGGDGMNVVLVNGSVKFVKADEIAELRWTVDEPYE